MNRKRVISSLVAIGITALGLQPASAQSFRDVQNFLRAQGGGGSFNQVSNNINIGLNTVQSQISTKVASGQISSYDAAMLNSRVQEIAAMSRAMGADRQYSGSEVQQLLSEMNALNAQVSASNSFAAFSPYGAVNPYAAGAYGIPTFNNFNAVQLYQQQLLNQINSNRFSAAQRQAWRNEYNSFAPFINQRYISGNFGNNQYVKRMIRLQQQIRDNQRIATRNDWRDDHRNDNRWDRCDRHDNARWR